MARRDTRRRFEQWVKNTNCEANTISAVAGVSMADVAEANGFEATMGQSPFAIARGTVFEAGLFRDDAKRLRAALEEKGVLPRGSSGFADLRLRLNGGPMPDQETALARTREILSAVGAGDPTPSIIASATLQIPGMPVMLPDGVLAIDVLVLRPAGDRQELVIGEIKSYPDRAGHTDAAELATSRAQAGVYLHALDLVVADLGLGEQLDCARSGFLVLARSGSNEPSIRAGEDLTFQALRAQRGFARLRAAAKALTPFDPDDLETGIAAVNGAGRRYDPTCLSFCDLAPACRHDAEAAGDPAILGEDVKRFLGTVTLPRAIELLSGATPQNDVELDLTTRMQAS